MNKQAEALFEIIDVFNQLRSSPEFMAFVAKIHRDPNTKRGELCDEADRIKVSFLLSALPQDHFAHILLTEVLVDEDLPEQVQHAVIKETEDDVVINRLAITSLAYHGINVNVEFGSEDFTHADFPGASFYCNEFAL
jgi:hypothetical protein